MHRRNQKPAKSVKKDLSVPVVDAAACRDAFHDACQKKQYKKAAAIAESGWRAFPENWEFPYGYAAALFNDGNVRWGTPPLEDLEKILGIADFIIGALEGKFPALTSLPEKDDGPYILRAFALLGRGKRLYDVNNLNREKKLMLNNPPLSNTTICTVYHNNECW